MRILKRFVFILILATGCDEGLPNASTEDSGTSSSAFVDDLESHNTGLWAMADGWANGAPFWVGWRSDHIEFINGILRLRLDDQFCPMGCVSQPYASGEYRTNTFFSYGCIKSRFKAAKGAGVVSS